MLRTQLRNCSRPTYVEFLCQFTMVKLTLDLVIGFNSSFAIISFRGKIEWYTLSLFLHLKHGYDNSNTHEALAELCNTWEWLWP